MKTRPSSALRLAAALGAAAALLWTVAPSPATAAPAAASAPSSPAAGPARSVSGVGAAGGDHTLKYAAGAHGSIEGAARQTVADGTAGSAVRAVPAAGYRFAAWTDGSKADPRRDRRVTADLAVKAIFLPRGAGVARPWTRFTIAVLPDTQSYVQDRPGIFDRQTQWVADHAKADNIVFVAQLGDLVETYDSPLQWRRARSAMAIVRAAGIPYSVVPGNHDEGFDLHDLSGFDAAFPSTDFSGFSWYGGHYPATSDANNCELFSAMGQKFVVLNLVCDPTLLTGGATDWANAVLSRYADRTAIVVTHGYVNAFGGFVDGGSVSGAAVWDDVVRLHDNVVAVLCGHYPGEYHGTSIGEEGNTVYNLLSDYQDEPAGGDGWLRLYEFFPLRDTVKAVTYSPCLHRYRTDAGSEFSLPLVQDSHRVTFRSGGKVCDEVAAASGSLIAAPRAPTRRGARFAGWCADRARTHPVSLPYRVTADATLYAKWTR